MFHDLYLVVEQTYKTIQKIDIKVESSVDDVSNRNCNDVVSHQNDNQNFSDSDDECKTSTKPVKIRKQKSKSASFDNKTLELKKKVKKIRIEAVKNNAIVRKHFKMLCDLCEFPFDTFLIAKKHHLDVHKQKGYLMCCDKKFSKLYSVLQHCKLHENPQAFQCKHCAKNFLGSSGLRDHLHTVHASADEKIFLCDLCPKSFALEYMLTKHKRMQHVSDEDKKFACDICGQK